MLEEKTFKIIVAYLICIAPKNL